MKQAKVIELTESLHSRFFPHHDGVYYNSLLLIFDSAEALEQTRKSNPKFSNAIMWIVRCPTGQRAVVAAGWCDFDPVGLPKIQMFKRCPHATVIDVCNHIDEYVSLEDLQYEFA